MAAKAKPGSRPTPAAKAAAGKPAAPREGEEWESYPGPSAHFATDPRKSRGRLHPERESGSRTPFQRDRDRIIHASAFRRLKQKTQVFVAHDGDVYRTRLTHSLEVSQIARSITRRLGLCEDLAEALALAHDLGHPPFGHAGERALDELMAPYGGFDHNAQTLRVLTELERVYPHFDGLNLCWETLEGVVKHNGPLIGPKAERDDPLKPRAHKDEDPTGAIRGYSEIHDLEIDCFAGPEAQIAAFADDVAYNNHDIDDGLRAGLFRVDDLIDADLPLVSRTFKEVLDAYRGVERSRQIHEAVRRLIGFWVDDLTAETVRRIKELDPAGVEDIYRADAPVASFSRGMADIDRALREFLFENMYRHVRVNRAMSQARRVVRDLFELFLDEPETLPAEARQRAAGPKSPQTARVACDVIAAMTDIAAIEEHRALFNLDRWI